MISFILDFMRIDFGSKKKQIQFFEDVKPKDISWAQFYRVINSKIAVPRRTLRNWKNSLVFPSLEALEIICKIFNYELDYSQIKILPEYWGRRLGGNRKIEMYGFSLTRKDRVKGGLRAIKKLRQNFGPERMREVSSYAGSISVKNGTQYKRKVEGPNGEKMYNILEKEVAEILTKLGLKYEYEKVIHLENRYIVPDFIVEDRIVIESTYFYLAKYIAKRLTKKFHLYRKNLQMSKFVVVTNDELKGEYTRLLKGIATVLVTKDLPGWLAEN